MSQVSQINPINTSAQPVSTAATTGISSDTFAQLLSAQLNSSLMRMASSQTDETNFMGGTSDLMNLFLTGTMLQNASATFQSLAAEETPETSETDVTTQQGSQEQHHGLMITRVYSPDIPSSTSATQEPRYTQAHQDSALSALTRVGDPYSQAKRGVEDYVDCSYLTQWAYGQNGISIPGTAAEQARYCIQNGFEVSRSNLKTGDLVFWQKPGCTCGRYDEIHHVGIYLGDDRVIEASSSRGQVVVNDLWDGDGWKLAFFARPS